MSIQERTGAPMVLDPSPVSWGAVIAGAVVAAALAFVLHSFAAAMGLAVSSTAPTWRDASIALWVLSGVYLILVAFVSYAVGGYIAGWLRNPSSTASADEVEFRNGIHGVLVWGLATLLTALLILGTAGALTRIATRAADPATSVAGESTIAFDLDRLFRADRAPPAGGDLTYTRAEAARILLTSSSHTGVAREDRDHLVRIVAARTGVQPAEAERRVDAAIVAARNNIGRARKSTVILAFMAGAAALIGAAVAWFAAGLGGQHRNDPNALASVWWMKDTRKRATGKTG